jgi:outer membrane protein assembly factor BamB
MQSEDLKVMKNWNMNSRFVRTLMVLALGITLLLVFALIFTPQLQTLIGTPAPVPGDDWSMYLHDVQRTAAGGEVILSPANASQLTRLWVFKTKGGVAASPIVAKGTVYVGSWDGYEYALDAVTGFLKWKTYLGQTSGRCDPPLLGITSSAAVVDNVVYVGGGDSYWYALDAYTGGVLWKVYTGDTSPDRGYYNWSSPLIYKGYAYIGIASNCDNPLVRGALLKVDLATHKIVNSLTLVGPNEVGAGIWTSPTLDAETGTIYVTTGTQNQIWQTLAQAMVAVDLNTMKIKGSWQIPLSQSGGDYDWGNSAVLTTDAAGRKLVAGTNKNGFTYAFKRDDISAGPVWEKQTGLGGQCPICGQGSVSSGAFANGTLYMAGGNTIIGGKGYPGAIRAMDPGTGKYLWEHGVPGPVIPAIAYANGLIIDGEGQTIEVLDARTGTRLYSYQTAQDIYSPPSVAHGQIFIGSLDGNVYSFGLGSAMPLETDPQCPQHWLCQDIGAPKMNGTESYTNTTWNVSGNGTGFADISDQFRFVSQEVSGDAQVSARVTPQGPKNTLLRAGVMMRQSKSQGSPFFAAFFTGSNGVVVQYRTAFNGAIVTINSPALGIQPHYVAIQRIGDSFRAAISNDGKRYILVPGSTAVIVMPEKLMDGIAISSGINGTLATAEFADVNLARPQFTPATPDTANPCPQGWNCADVGNPQLIGDQIVANGKWALKGEGKDIWLANDQFHFAWQILQNDSTVSAHVIFQTKIDGREKAGVMLRKSMDADSVYYGAFETPDQGVVVQARSVEGLNTDIVTSNTVVTAPHYLRIARWNNIFTTYVSPNGIDWSALGGSTIALNVQGAMLGGIAVSSHNVKASSTVNFDSVSTMQTAIPAPTACVDNWHCEDVGYPAPHGTQLFDKATDTWTLRGGGFDIFFKTDQFHFVWQPMIGDGALSARVRFVDPGGVPGNDYAKAGVMMRTTTDPGSPYYAAFLTAEHGVMVQYRKTNDDGTGEAVIPDPIKGAVYLKIVRVGTLYSAYVSNDGAVWQIVDGSTVDINMGDTVKGGLAITSHDPGNLRVATFDNIQF